MVPGGRTCDEIATTMDLLPTFVRLAGGSPRNQRAIDGHDIWPLLAGLQGATSPYMAFYYYHMDQLHAVRSGRWKLHLPSLARRVGLGNSTVPSEARLYDLNSDIGETASWLALVLRAVSLCRIFDDI